ncbi:DUF5994 family protein [Saccharopolyspora elongata]|uniref:Uncharacterized protein n=1 Tax=Saccharopolyspora elongata TaxID=2530387 RepID=A0A4R4XS61_9PSEU|nr:DUF5994 family protein [Saccharopolyspora elongata]TDD33779.1 hypothetical protein E1288_45210 [Saccharopolyspora elongata]
MGPDQLNPGTAQATSAGACVAVKPETGTRGFVDGAWWPRSVSPTTEFTALLTALAATRGPMTRLAYNPAAWEPAPRKLRIEGHQVRLEGFHTLDQHTVSLTDPSGHRMVLLVIPADTTELRGNAVLMRASEPDNVATPRDLLADAPNSVPAVVPQPTEASPEARWETDGGHLLAVR